MASARQGPCTGLEELLGVDEAAARLGVRVAYTILHGPPVSTLDSSRLAGEVAALLEELQSRYTLESLKEDPVVRAYRDFYWRIKIDPTKTRPSSEALVRRALRGRFPRINPIVDAGNIASARAMVPIGLYDLDKAKPPLRLTITRGGEEFHPIGGGEEHLPPGIPVLVDSTGLVLHLYPHRDSRHTSIQPGTTRVLALAAGVPGVPRERLDQALRELSRLASLLGWETCPNTTHKP